jgi:hypothetical protein
MCGCAEDKTMRLETLLANGCEEMNGKDCLAHCVQSDIGSDPEKRAKPVWIVSSQKKERLSCRLGTCCSPNAIYSVAKVHIGADI